MMGEKTLGYAGKVWVVPAVLLTGMAAALSTWPAHATQSAVKLLMQTNQALFEEVDRQRDAIAADPGVARAVVRELLTPHLDLERTSRWVLGKFWRKATDDQKGRFIQEFRTLLVRTYATAVTEFSGVELVYHPIDAEDDADDVTVKTEITNKKDAIFIVYRLHLNDDGWKVYDVTVNGVSLVTTYRSTFSRLVRNDGMDGLILRLAEKNRETTS